MKYKKIIYLMVVILSLIATGYEFFITLEDFAVEPIRFIEIINNSGLGLIVLALIIMKIAFDISFVFEMILLTASIGAVTVLYLMGSQIIEPMRGMLIQTVFPILGALFIIEYIKDLLLSDKVFTSKGIMVKGLLSAVILFVILSIGSIYNVVSGYNSGIGADNVSSAIVLFFMVMIYIVKMGYKRDIRELVEHSYFVEDLKRLLKDTLKVYELILVVFYLGVIVLYFYGLLPFIFAFAFMVGGIFFAARGYRQWMFPFVLLGTLSFMTYINHFTAQKIAVLDYAKGTAYGIILILVFVWGSRIVIATSNRNIES
ncbi:MAG: hypothetical protein K8R73_00325 [Clostridiales bacterium]|nr:hypothetical protein [Clostridiales bacterium]